MRFNTVSRLIAVVMIACVLLSAFIYPDKLWATESDQSSEISNLFEDLGQFDLKSNTSDVSISINYTEIELDVGKTKALIATTVPAGQTVQWQSTDNSIATVNNGVVTAQNIGTTTILAAYIDSDRNMYVAECTVHVRLPNGRYFLQNKQTGYYADIKGPTMASGTTIHQWKYNGNDSQKWIFTHLGDGYYSIKSANSSTSYYLGVINDSNGLNVDIVLRSGSLTNGMKWKVETTASGAYKLIPKTGEANGYILGTSTSDATNGAKLIQGAYVNNNSYRDEWYLDYVDPIVKLDLVYDFAFRNRYSDAASRVSEEITRLQEKFLTEFGIRIDCSSFSSFYSYADSYCSTTPDQACTHATNDECYNSGFDNNGSLILKTYHHKNVYNIMHHISHPDLSSSVKLAYTGHSNCITVRDDQGSLIRHGTNPYQGLANRSLGLAMVMHFSSVTNQTATMVHEFGHLYGAKDHHGTSSYPSSDDMNDTYGDIGFDINCIYGERMNISSIKENLTICDGCKSFIESNRNIYDHS